jgi:hypothetical protein
MLAQKYVKGGVPTGLAVNVVKFGPFGTLVMFTEQTETYEENVPLQPVASVTVTAYESLEVGAMVDVVSPVLHKYVKGA